MGIGPEITYKGIDLSERDADFRKGYMLPGDRARFDSGSRVSGVDPHDVANKVGWEPVTISKSIITGIERNNGVGGKNTMIKPEYEFEGIEGRFAAASFHEEAGRDHMYGVVALRDDRMWAVPLSTNFMADSREALPEVTGSAREIVAFVGKNVDQLHPDGLEGMKGMLADGAIAGEFTLQPIKGYGDVHGPVGLMHSPWSSQTDPREMQVANKAIDQAVAHESLDAVVETSRALLKVTPLTHEDGRERAEPAELQDAIRERGFNRNGHVTQNLLDAAIDVLQSVDDRGASGGKEYAALANSVETAVKAVDGVLPYKPDLIRAPSIERLHDVAAEPALASAVAPALQPAVRNAAMTQAALGR